MNTVKLYRLSPAGKVKIMLVKCTQSTKFYARLKRTRTLPYAHEAHSWGLKNGWSRKRPGALRTNKSKLALSVRRTVLDVARGL